MNQNDEIQLTRVYLTFSDAVDIVLKLILASLLVFALLGIVIGIGIGVLAAIGAS